MWHSHDVWIVQDFVGREWHLSLVFNAEAPGGLERTQAVHTVGELLYFAWHGFLQHDRASTQFETVEALLDVYERLTGTPLLPEGWSYRHLDVETLRHAAETLANELERSARRGELRVEPGRSWMDPVAFDAAPDTTRTPSVSDFAPPSAPPSVVEGPNWVGVLVHDDDGLPVANVRCLITPSDGATIECMTGPDGLVRLERIAGSACTIEFLEVDAHELNAQSGA